MRLISIVLTSLAISACTDTSRDSGTPYSSAYCNAFLEACEKGAIESGAKNPEEYCECTLERIKKLYPSESEASKLTVLQLQGIATICKIETE